jgi:hypothetical protein
MNNWNTIDDGTPFEEDDIEIDVEDEQSLDFDDLELDLEEETAGGTGVEEEVETKPAAEVEPEIKPDEKQTNRERARLKALSDRLREEEEVKRQLLIENNTLRQQQEEAMKKARADEEDWGSEQLQLLESHTASLQKQWAAAEESGDTEAKSDINTRLMEATYKKAMLQQEQARRKKVAEQAAAATQRQTPSETPPPSRTPSDHPKAIQFIRKNRMMEWSNSEKQLAAQMANHLEEEFYSPDEDEFWSELSKRLSGALPGKFTTKVDSNSKDDTINSQGKVMQPVREAGRRKKTIKLTEADRIGMEVAGMDYRNPKDVKQYLAFQRGEF